MALNITSPNMSLVIPTVGQEPGPTFAFDINSSLTLIDQHDHSLGKGVQITPAGLNINADLSLNNNQLVDTKSIIFEAQSANLTDIQELYVAPGSEVPTTSDLWYNDGNGVAIQLTKNGAVNASIASLPGESYAAGTFTWRQGDGSTVPANFDIGSIIIRPNVAGTSFGVQLQPNAGISSQYDISLPLLPAAQSFLTIDNTGVMAAPINFNLGITAANLAPNSVTTTKISDGNVTYAKLADDAVPFQATTVTSASTIFAPGRASMAWVLMAGGGGGGGGGGGSGGSVVGAGGGGGGGGGASAPFMFPVKITPGQSITIVSIGAGGTGGSGGGGNGGGGDGTTGGTTQIIIGSQSYTVSGGTGGRGGSVGPGSSGGAGGGANNRALLWANGGRGGDGNAAGSSGDGTVYAGGGTGGTSGGSKGGGGGGGGASLDTGGGGGNGQTSAAGQSGSSGPTSFSGAGGGGGSGGANSGGANIGAPGGNGRSGFVTFYWQA